MASLDDIYDLTEKLDAEKMDYVILALRAGSRSNKVDVFLQIKAPTSRRAILAILEQLVVDLREEEDDDTEGPDVTNDGNFDF
jgi:hypothetical protein|tara:strand:+ start:184 stop:432 length:249 start_codon:yes stop_codon:yes gene_type:complete